MPAFLGLRPRPSSSPLRVGTAQFISSPGFVEAVPKSALFPLLALAAIALISTTVWVHDMYVTDQVAEIEMPRTTGTVSTR